MMLLLVPFWSRELLRRQLFSKKVTLSLISNHVNPPSVQHHQLCNKQCYWYSREYWCWKDHRSSDPLPFFTHWHLWKPLDHLEHPDSNSPPFHHHPPDSKPSLRGWIPDVFIALFHCLFGKTQLDLYPATVQDSVVPLQYQHVRFNIFDNADESAQDGGCRVAETCWCSERPEGTHSGVGGTVDSCSLCVSTEFGFLDHFHEWARAKVCSMCL